MKRLGMIVAIAVVTPFTACTTMTPQQQGTVTGAAVGGVVGGVVGNIKGGKQQ